MEISTPFFSQDAPGFDLHLPSMSVLRPWLTSSNGQDAHSHLPMGPLQTGVSFPISLVISLPPLAFCLPGTYPTPS